MQRTVVIGLGFGDEGKGVVTDYLCSQNPRASVIRFSGGHQCAHTVTYKKMQHVFANFGSGTLRGCPTYWSKFCTFEPVGFCREYAILRKKGFRPKIHIHWACPVVTPYDIIANQTSKERMYGTTGTGFWKTIERNKNGLSLEFMTIMEAWPRYLSDKIEKILRYYGYKNACPFDFYASIEQLKALRKEGILSVGEQEPLDNVDMIFEGAQGLLLDKDSKFFPHVTPSKTNMDNIFELGYKPKEVYLVTRAYQTRHGAGPMTNENIPLNIHEKYEEATKENQFQGKLRKTVLDLDLLERAVKKEIDQKCRDNRIVKHLVITCFDHLKERPSLTHNNQLKQFECYESFAHYIKRILGIDGEVYGNYTPHSNTIVEMTTTSRYDNENGRR